MQVDGSVLAIRSVFKVALELRKANGARALQALCAGDANHALARRVGWGVPKALGQVSGPIL